MEREYGTRIERGIIIEVCSDGYKVESYSRDGMITLSLPADQELEAGNWVYFFVFPDGRGKIIGKF